MALGDEAQIVLLLASPGHLQSGTYCSQAPALLSIYLADGGEGVELMILIVLFTSLKTTVSTQAKRHIQLNTICIIQMPSKVSGWSALLAPSTRIFFGRFPPVGQSSVIVCRTSSTSEMST